MNGVALHMMKRTHEWRRDGDIAISRRDAIHESVSRCDGDIAISRYRDRDAIHTHEFSLTVHDRDGDIAIHASRHDETHS